MTNSEAFWNGFRKGLGQPIAWPVGWACFWLGHFWSRYVINLWPDSWERSGEVMARPYFTLMRWSVELSDVFDLGIWGPSERRNEKP